MAAPQIRHVFTYFCFFNLDNLEFNNAIIDFVEKNRQIIVLIIMKIKFIFDFQSIFDFKKSKSIERTKSMSVLNSLSNLKLTFNTLEIYGRMSFSNYIYKSSKMS